MEKFSLPEGTGVAAIGLKTGLIFPNDDIVAITAETAKPFVDAFNFARYSGEVSARVSSREGTVNLTSRARV